MTSEQMQMISADPRVMHGQAVLAGTRVPVSVILDCLAAGMAADEIATEYPVVSLARIRAAAAYGVLPPARNSSRYRRPGESSYSTRNLPGSAATNQEKAMPPRKRQALALSAATILTVALPLTITPATAQASLAPMMLPAYAHGTITGAGPHSGVKIVLIAWPEQSAMGKVRVGQKVPTRVLGRATSSSDGTYVIHQTVRLKNGLRNLEVIGQSSKAVGSFSFAAVIRGKKISSAASGSKASTKPISANIHMRALPKSEWSVVQPSGYACDATPVKIRELGQKNVDVGGLYSLMPNGKIQETYSTGAETTISVDASVGGIYGGYTGEGTFTRSTSSSEPFKTQVGKIVNQQTPYTFGLYRVCLLDQIQPEVWATGQHVVSVNPPPLGKDTCGEHIPGGLTFTRSMGRAGTFTAGLDFEKDKLSESASFQSGYNKDVSITYTFPPGGGYMCGTNALPTASAFDEMSPLGNPTSQADWTSKSK